MHPTLLRRQWLEHAVIVQLELLDAGYGDDATAVLIDELQKELTERYGGPDVSPVDPLQFTAPTGVFLVAVLDGESVGCVGLRPADEADVELKRMYVRPGHRRRGLARLILAAVEDRARQLGYARVLLETGLEQPEAIALYESHGYRRITGFGHYQCEPRSRSYAKTL